MDGHPRTLFIQGVNVAASLTLGHPTEFFRYLVSGLALHDPLISGTARLLQAGAYLTQQRYYSRSEALQALALPGPAPTHVAKLVLPAGSRLLGPAWVEPLPYGAAFASPDRHRYGFGIEYVTLDRVSLTPDSYSVEALPND